MKKEHKTSINYSFSMENANQQFIKIIVDVPEGILIDEIKLPVWRPGRYEIANFAKNIKGFKIFDLKDKSVSFSKKDKSTWKLKSKSLKGCRIEYLYYANEINAGSSYLDKQMLYINPVNCCVYLESHSLIPCTVNILIPENWKIASGMNKKNNAFYLLNFDQLADSPFICSPDLQCQSYEVKNYKFTIWVNGNINPEWKKWIKDFEAFTQKQIEKFIEFPVKEYHFLIHALPYSAYHGVEHLTNTVISLGPDEKINTSLYKELLGVSSHELYHAWNVKSIRPKEMLPYDFSKENYSELGYIYEGITTYMGDLFLLKSNVFTLDQYFDEFNKQLQKHFDNLGRFNYSVAESSFDTWLDGYVLGAPGRKVSIYVEGCLLAFVADVLIHKHTLGKYGLDEVMKRLYFNHSMKGKGITEEIYKNELENITGVSFDDYFQNYIHGTHSYESILNENLDVLGLEMNVNPSSNMIESKIGCKLFNHLTSKNRKMIASIYPGSPADLAGIKVGDELDIELINSKTLISNHIHYYRKGLEIKVELPQVSKCFFNKYSLSVISNPIKEQQRLFDCWRN